MPFPEGADTVCLACKRGTLAPGTTTATFDADGTTVVIRNVPAEVCDFE